MQFLFTLKFHFIYFPIEYFSIRGFVMNSINVRDFQPINTWRLNIDGPKWKNGQPEYLIDNSTKRLYWNENEEIVRLKCFLLSLGTPLVHLVTSIGVIMRRILKVVSFYHLWVIDKDQSYLLKGRVLKIGEELLGILITPLVYVALEISAIYGIFNPYDARKLYSSLERFQYKSFKLAPCFDVNPTYHALGGDSNQQNAF